MASWVFIKDIDLTCSFALGSTTRKPIRHPPPRDHPVWHQGTCIPFFGKYTVNVLVLLRESVHTVLTSPLTRSHLLHPTSTPPNLFEHRFGSGLVRSRFFGNSCRRVRYRGYAITSPTPSKLQGGSVRQSETRERTLIFGRFRLPFACPAAIPDGDLPSSVSPSRDAPSRLCTDSNHSQTF